MKTILLFCFFSIFTHAVFGTDYYVSTTGDDANNGSSESPWKTLTKACSSVAANQGHIINLGSGTFTEDKIITIPSGVSIVGAGSSASIVQIDFYYNPGSIDPHIQIYNSKFVIQMKGSNQTVKGFSLDGQNKCWGGIFAKHMTNSVFEDIFIYNFLYCGLFIPEFYNVEVKNCHLKDNAYGSKAKGDSGNFQFHDGNGLNVHDCLIEEKGAIGTMGGYGMKAVWYAGWDGGGAMFHKIKNLKIWNNTITVPEVGSWNNGQAPSIVIEFLGVAPNNMEIYNNNFNNTISIPDSYDPAVSLYPCGRIHNNNFQLGIARYSYAIEAGAHDLEIDHNLFDGGVYPIASFGQYPNNQTIHHNVFINQWADRSIIQHSNAISGFKCYNNTIVDTQGIGEIFESWFKPIVLNSPDIRNNIFMSTVKPRGNILNATIKGGTLSKNCFYNITASGSNNITLDPLLNLPDNKPAPYFQLQAGSPCINAGDIITGITDGSVGAPDIGAFEFGAEAWTVGTFRPSTKASISTGSISNIKATTATCGGNVSDDGGKSVTARGVCWSLSSNPTVEDSKTSDGEGLGVFSSSIIELTAGVTYYVRAYAINSIGISYGNEVTFAANNYAKTQSNVANFENGTTDNLDIITNNDNYNAAWYKVVENPLKNEINSTSKVLQFNRPEGEWKGLRFLFEAGLLSDQLDSISLDLLLTNKTSRLFWTLKKPLLNSGDDLVTVAPGWFAPEETNGQWGRITFAVSAVEPVEVLNLQIFPNPTNAAWLDPTVDLTDDTYYIDNVVLYKQSIVGETKIFSQKTNEIVSVYPNPSSGLVTIQSNISGQTMLNVYNMNGKLLLGKPNIKNCETLDLSEYKGVLLIKLLSANQTFSKKVVLY